MKNKEDVMIYRDLGATGEKVSLIGVGGWHLGLKYVDQKTAIRIVRSAIDRGINFMDNCWDYNGGVSENRMGKALRDGYREKVFLMTKIDGRTKKIAAEQIDESLKRLQTDCLDLVQHHEILRFEDPHRIFDEKDGAHLAMLDAQKAGKLRFIGFTGHKDPQIHLRMLEVADEYGMKLGHGANARQCDGRALSQFFKFGSAGIKQTKNGRSGDEDDGERHYFEIENRYGNRMSALRDESADFGCHHGN